MSRSTPTVAIVRSTTRRGAIAQALALLDDVVPVSLPAEVVILPDFGSAFCPWAWTQPDTVSATLDFVLARGTKEALILDPTKSSLAQTSFHPETLGRPVRFQPAELDVAEAWTRVTLDLGIGEPLTLRIWSLAMKSPALVALTTMKTDGQSTVALTLGNLLSLVHPADRSRFDPDDQTTRANRSIADHVILGTHRLRGRLKWYGQSILPRHCRERDERLMRLIAGLDHQVRPLISVIDGIVAMEREGPHHGEARTLNVVVAGTDPVATDAVAARLMGFDPTVIRHLRRANAERSSAIDFDAIHLVGDPIASVQSRCVPHSSEIYRSVAQLSDRASRGSQPESLPAPHARPARSRSQTRR